LARLTANIIINPVIKNVMKSRTLILSLLILFTFSGCGKAQESLDQDQQTALETTVFNGFDGNEYRISDFAGKTILLDFWETWCAPCISSMPALDQLMTDYRDDFVVFAVSPLWTDTEEDVKKFIERNDYQFVYVHANELANALNIRGIPFKVYVDPAGKFHKTELGSRGPAEDYKVISSVIEDLRGS
jgi:thiol-disulfide isomerase/thioredoxin